MTPETIPQPFSNASRPMCRLSEPKAHEEIKRARVASGRAGEGLNFASSRNALTETLVDNVKQHVRSGQLVMQLPVIILYRPQTILG